MSENVEIVRRYYETVDSALERHWAVPGTPVRESPLIQEVLDLLHPEAEWDTFLAEEPYRGREGMIDAVDEWLDAADDWRVKAESVTDLGEGRVLVVHRTSIRGKGSGVTIEQQTFSVAQVQDGKVIRLTDRMDREEALEAAGLPQ